MNHEALHILEQHDAWLRDNVGHTPSLDPEREHATTLATLGQRVLPKLSFDAPLDFAQALVSISMARVQHFPDNLFWDLDALATSLLSCHDLPTLTQRTSSLVQLHEVFGRHGSINFRYVHDFAYGYDWVRWVMRDPDTRKNQGPYAPDFIAYLLQRASELIALIQADDDKYPKLPDGRPRNPFGFSREPDAEIALHQELARRNLIPVPAWQAHPAPPQWDLSYAALRAQCSRELGIPEHRERS